jgi:hypothetical protein
MDNNTLSNLGMAAACAGLLSLAMQTQAAEPSAWMAAPLSKQCGLALNPQVDAAAQPYIGALVAVGGPQATWLPSVCPEAKSTTNDEGLQLVKAMLGAHLLHQVSTMGKLSVGQKKAIADAIEQRTKRKAVLATKDAALKTVYVDVRTQAAGAGMSADGLVYQLKDSATDVSKTLDRFAEKWGP